MPELPDVENFLNYFKATALHKNIEKIDVLEPKILGDVSALKLKRNLDDNSFKDAYRYGKNLFAETTGKYFLRLHFGMTGNLKYFKDENEHIKHVRLLLYFSNGYKLAYTCQRMFGEVSLVKDINEFVNNNKLGPDALKISFEDFKKIVTNSKRAIKSLLMDQSKISGLGNIYADEVLFQSGLRPSKSAASLDESQIRNLHRNIAKVLNYAIDCKADPGKFGKSYLLPVRGKNEKCPKCNTTLKTNKITGRTSYFCAKCQK